MGHIVSMSGSLHTGVIEDEKVVEKRVIWMRDILRRMELLQRLRGSKELNSKEILESLYQECVEWSQRGPTERTHRELELMQQFFCLWKAEVRALGYIVPPVAVPVVILEKDTSRKGRNAEKLASVSTERARMHAS